MITAPINTVVAPQSVHGRDLRLTHDQVAALVVRNLRTTGACTPAADVLGHHADGNARAVQPGVPQRC